MRLTARCVRGLEWVLAAEVERYDTADDIRLSERQVSFEVPRLGTDLLDLRTADDLLLDVATLRGIDHTRAALTELTRRLTRIDFAAAITRLGDVRTLPGVQGAREVQGVPGERGVRGVQRVATFDVVASLLGRRNYNRYAVEDAAGKVVANAIGARYVSRNPDSVRRPGEGSGGNGESGNSSGGRDDDGESRGRNGVRGASSRRGASGGSTASGARGASIARGAGSGSASAKGAASATDTAGTDFTVRLSLSGETVDVALRVPRKPLHRRPWKLDTGPGTLHPPLAAALVRIAGVGDGIGATDTGSGGWVLDPFCGDGTIAIEAALALPDANILAADLDVERLRNARANMLRAGLEGAAIAERVRFVQADAGQTNWRDSSGDLGGLGNLRDLGDLERAENGENLERFERFEGLERAENFGGFDALVTNPPWNRAVGAAGALADTLDPFWRHVPSCLTSHGRICTIAEADLDIPARLSRMGYSVALAQTIRLAGRVSHVVLAAPPGADEVRLPRGLDLWHERAIKAGIVSPDGF